MNSLVFGWAMQLPALAVCSQQAQELKETVDINSLSAQLDQALSVFRIADSAFDAVLTEEAALASKGLTGVFWVDSGSTRLKRVYSGLEERLQPARSFLRCHGRMSCPQDKDLLEGLIDSELGSMEFVVLETVEVFKKSIEIVRKMPVTDSEAPLQTRVLESGSSIEAAMKAFLDLVKRRMSVAMQRQSRRGDTRAAKAIASTKSVSAAAIDEATAELAKLGVEAGRLFDQMRKAHGGDISGPLLECGGVFRLGAFTEYGMWLRPAKVVMVCHSSMACEADRAVILPYVYEQMHEASELVRRGVSEKERGIELLRALGLEGEDASLRDDSIKAGTKAAIILRKLGDTLKTEEARLYGTK